MHRSGIPLEDQRESIESLFLQHGPALLKAPPGAGKSTGVPLLLLDHPQRLGRQILLLQPRQAAARSVAHRLKELAPRASIGLLSRSFQEMPKRPDIIVMTEGVFLRRLIADPELNEVWAVLFDEFHERSLSGDLSFTLSLQSRELFREDLKLLLMSATLNLQELQGLFSHSLPKLELEEKLYPVDLKYQPLPPGKEDQAFIELCLKEMKTCPGNILVFLPGQGQIDRYKEELQQRADPEEWQILRLYSRLKLEEQLLALDNSTGKGKRIILSTNLAETSLTLNNIHLVIDSGLRKIPINQGPSGLNRLLTRRISLSSAIQRMGRAGRTAVGRCIRLWSANENLEEQDHPALLRENLEGLVLDLAAWGDCRIESYSWVTPPPGNEYERAKEQLIHWKLLDSKGSITPLGETIQRLPLSPGLALLSLKDESRLLAALLEVGSPLNPLGQSETMGNCHKILDYLMEWKSRGSHPLLVQNKAAEIWRDYQRLERKIQRMESPANQSFSVMELFAQRAAQLQESGNYKLITGREMRLHHGKESKANLPSWILALGARHGEKSRGIVDLYLTPTEEEKNAFFNEYVKEEEILHQMELRLQARKRRSLGKVILKEYPIPLKELNHPKKSLLLWLKANPLTVAETKLYKRLRYIHLVLGSPWPEVSQRASENHMESWIEQFVTLPLSPHLIRAFPWDDCWLSLIPWELQSQLPHIAPEKMDLPSGSRCSIQYKEDRAFAAMRIQQVFGLMKQPLAGGKPIELELLSPASRPLQITSDLPGFWRGSYQDVRREMRGRYPKHYWPENPLDAEPTDRAKPRK